MSSSIVEVDPVPAAPAKKRKMKPGGGKRKGSSFEAVIAKKLTTELKPLNFIRTQGSGARVGGKNFETIGQMFGEDALKIFVGDVVPVNENKENKVFLHSIECKSYATPDNFTSLASGTANVLKWFEEVVVDAEKVKKNPLLIFKWNHTPVYAALDTFWQGSQVSQVLLSRNIHPCFTLLTYGQNKRSIDIYYLDTLLQVKEFWFSEKK